MFAGAPLPLSTLWLLLLTTFAILTDPSTSSMDSFIYGGCTQLRFTPGSPYESNVNSLLTSLINSATTPSVFAPFNKFTAQGSIPSDDGAGSGPVYGLYQCRGDLQPSECGQCIVRSVSQLGTLCPNSCGGALQLEGCFIKYDNATFLGVEEKTVVFKKCGPLMGYNSMALTRRDAVLAYINGGDQFFRVGGSGEIQGMAQCVGDLSTSECQDCLSDAIQRLKTECGAAASGDMFLGKCYARYWEGGDHSSGKRLGRLRWWLLAFCLCLIEHLF
ncbi:plasmodesmata-located protein 7-like [Malania oleifera]|uniref:plasmodesmata-located protein 7-like n=1 Tax=Malania oleifera TaxID=397392 RepID=UPI0025ADE980|nr:plasmodesmata-located protein 7-like [Malania oleifera]